MGNIVDVQGLYNIGKAMGKGSIRDNRQHDAMIRFVGGQALGLLANAFGTRAAMRKEASKTATNASINLEDGGYDPRMLNQATAVVEKGKKDLYKASGIFKNKNKGAELIERTNNDLKNLQTGMDWVKDKVEIWEGIYKNGTFKTSKGDMRVSINPASSAESQALASSFADGSIYDSMTFKDGQWGIMQTIDQDGDLQRPQFIPLDDLELPELDESKSVLDFEKSIYSGVEEQGYKSQTGDFTPFREDARENAFQEYKSMSFNQVSSRFFAKNRDGSYPALNYLMQEGGFTIGSETYEAIKDPNELNITAEEQLARQQKASGYLEMLKNDDLNSDQMLNYLVDSELMPGIEEKFQRGFDQRPVKEEEKVEYKSPYTPNEVAKMDKYKLANENWNTFMTPKPHEGSKTEFKNPPTPKEQIEWVVNNLSRRANIVHNPTDDETGKVLNGFYTEVQYEGIEDGEAVVVSDYKLINPGNTINFENLSGVMDYSQMPLKPRFIKK
jgi:hypothetical protein